MNLIRESKVKGVGPLQNAPFCKDLYYISPTMEKVDERKLNPEVRYEKGKNMKISELQCTIRSFLENKHYFFIAYFFFMLCFFIVPSTHLHNNLFYGLILLPYLVTLQLKRIKLIYRSKLWLLSMVLAIYMCDLHDWES